MNVIDFLHSLLLSLFPINVASDIHRPTAYPVCWVGDTYDQGFVMLVIKALHFRSFDFDFYYYQNHPLIISGTFERTTFIAQLQKHRKFLFSQRVSYVVPMDWTELCEMMWTQLQLKFESIHVPLYTNRFLPSSGHFGLLYGTNRFQRTNSRSSSAYPLHNLRRLSSDWNPGLNRIFQQCIQLVLQQLLQWTLPDAATLLAVPSGIILHFPGYEMSLTVTKDPDIFTIELCQLSDHSILAISLHKQCFTGTTLCCECSLRETCTHFDLSELYQTPDTLHIVGPTQCFVLELYLWNSSKIVSHQYSHSQRYCIYRFNELPPDFKQNVHYSHFVLPLTKTLQQHAYVRKDFNLLYSPYSAMLLETLQLFLYSFNMRELEDYIFAHPTSQMIHWVRYLLS